MTVLDRPIVLLGAARSGTTLTAEILEHHPDVAYWVEPKYVWRYRNPRAATDARPPSEATPQVRAYIRAKFEAYRARNGAARFMEKTPSNCFRVPFVHAVLPDARFVHLVRDGRDVALSAERKWTTPPDPSAIRRRLRLARHEIPLRDAPFYAVDTVRDVLGRQFMPAQAFIWGPHFPGIREVRRTHTVLETCAIQWRESAEAAIEGLRAVPDDHVLEVRFERLIRTPRETLEAILDFLGLSSDAALIDYAQRTIDRSAAQRWPAELERVGSLAPLLDPTLEALGYATTPESLAT
ncbi:MAG: sulfotransferase [Bacteroidota bacterium]